MDLLRAAIQEPAPPGLARPLHGAVLPRRGDSACGRSPSLLRVPPPRCESIRGKMGAGEGRRNSARARNGCRSPEGRLNGRDKRTHEMPVDELPDGAFIAIDGHASVVRGAHLLRWSENGYVGKDHAAARRRNRAHAAEHRRGAVSRLPRRNGIRVLNPRCIHKTRRRSTGPANTHTSHCHKPMFLIAVGSVLDLFFLQ